MSLNSVLLHWLQVIGISRNEELAWQAVEDLKEEFPGAAISYKVLMPAVHTTYGSVRLSLPTHTSQPISHMFQCRLKRNVHGKSHAQCGIYKGTSIDRTLRCPPLCGAQVCNMEVLSEVQSVADELIASDKPIRCACATHPPEHVSHSLSHKLPHASDPFMRPSYTQHYQLCWFPCFKAGHTMCRLTIPACQIDKAPMFVPTVCLTECSILINCAGRFLDEQFKLTREGIEQTLALDYYAHVLLSLRLIDTLISNGPSRIINASRWASTDVAALLAASFCVPVVSCALRNPRPRAELEKLSVTSA